MRKARAGAWLVLALLLAGPARGAAAADLGNPAGSEAAAADLGNPAGSGAAAADLGNPTGSEAAAADLRNPAPARAAVLVGANAAPAGRSDLRFAHRDARRMAEVLTEVGRFAPADVDLLLDPSPRAVLAALDRRLKALRDRPGESLLVFYYSGHADGRHLYPDGSGLSLEALRARLSGEDATVRVGILDACRGGAWTRAKGLHPDAPFEVRLPEDLRAEGSVLMASSSGSEDAHEAAALEGSFFTHHLVGALRGAADENGDGAVSVGEAFAYARERTVRDSLLLSGRPQHPSFALDLRGRTDLALTRPTLAASTVVLSQTRGPLRLVHAETGSLLLELPRGARRARLAVPPARYLLVREDERQTHLLELTVGAGETVRVSEAELRLAGRPRRSFKGVAPGAPRHSTVRVALGYGRSPFAGVLHSLDLGWSSRRATSAGPQAALQVSIPMGERLTLHPVVPNVSWRFGDGAPWDAFLWAGFGEWQLSGSLAHGALALSWLPGGGVDYCFRFEPVSLNVTLSFVGGRTHPLQDDLGVPPWKRNQQRATAGVSLRVGRRLTFNAGLAVSSSHLTDPTAEDAAGRTLTYASLGSVQQVNRQALPLVRVAVTERWALDLDGRVGVNWETRTGFGSLLTGATWTF